MFNTDNEKRVSPAVSGDKKCYTAAVFAVKRLAHLNESHGLNALYFLRETIESQIKEILYGGEHFSADEFNSYSVILNGTEEDCRMRMNHYFESVSGIMLRDKRRIKVTFVCGLYQTDDISGDLQDVFGRARSAMRAANYISGFTDIVPYSEDILIKEQKELTIERDLFKAVRDRELVIEIQPKFSFETGECVSAEALVRWEHPTLGRLLPDEFIPAAERTGDIIDIDMYVLETVCSHMRRWMDRGVNPVPIAVNQSRLHIADPHYADSVYRVMQEYDVWPSLIELETTESIAFNDYDSVVSILKALRDFGFVLSMDDFGSGYSSVHMLSELEYDVLKLDQKLIRNSRNKGRSYSMLKHIIAMAHDLDMTVVAEGVETVEQAEMLRNAGCDLAQGFLYSYPLTIEKFDADVFGLITL